MFSIFLLFLAALTPAVAPTSVTDIRGTAFRSSLAGKTVSGITGVVTAKTSSGFFLSGEPVNDTRVSNGIYVFGSSAVKQVDVGDSVSLSGKVAEYRSESDYFYLTEISSPSSIKVLSSNNDVNPVVIGVDRIPPTQYLSSLDVGDDGWLSVPNNQSLLSTTNPTLQPDVYGMDFWQSLDGQLVQINSPVAINFENSYGEFWVHGDWKVTGLNGRGGLTITFGPDGIPDANPEVVIIGSPTDGTKNPTVAVGVKLSDIVGVVTYQFGFYYVLPLTAPTVIATPDYDVPPTTISSETDSCVITFGDYNVENMAPTSAHLPTVAKQISDHLLIPDILFLQEIQDNSGSVNDGVVDANLTLSTLASAIANASGLTYKFIDINPEDGKDGGQPGGNIRQAYLYNADKLQLVSGMPAGTSLESLEVFADSGGLPTLSLNPGRIDPTNEAWEDSRKPLVAEWETSSGAKLFTINVHFVSKGGSTSTQGDPRPPVNSPIEQRTSQVGVTSSFIKSILDIDDSANIVIAGDFNEYVQTRSVFASLQEVLEDIDGVAGIADVERYTYVYDQNTQQLDHIFISSAIVKRGVETEHIHVNNWSPSYDDRTSDHDPTVGKIRLC
ncbi:Endonuclease/exonuclease/phosphatase [Armillaria borealis]|uniref:Endonuclease/exonuclease/phosphatase n=1 Tax=Armillaria borealis TaxID=47425 RepID=A0AA39J278_9AGAR|nr:Endonuclease/exonuclease/phosphatase [Armillaria borealis]